MSLTLEFFKRSTNITARVIADSISPLGKRITTLEIEYPRFILAELNTHKALEKNSSSSRAIPIMKMIEQIQSNMAVPLYWGKTKAGMQADGEIDSIPTGKKYWNEDFLKARNTALGLSEIGLHKQTANRLLEPFQMMKTVITGTDWDNFFNLRIHPDAQPEFCMLAYKIYKAMAESTPTLLKSGQWHLPYVNIGWNGNGEIVYFDEEFNVISLEQAQRISSSCCAQTSYRKSDASLEKADDIFQKLVGADVLHASPFGHLATPVQDIKVVYKDLDYVFADSLINLEKSVNISHITPTWEKGITHINRNGVFCSGNLQGWISYRHLMDNNTCYEFNFEVRMKLFEVKSDA